MLITNFFFGLLVVAAGVLGIKFNFKLVNLFGRNNIFEQKLGAGTTYPMFQLFAILTILFGILLMFSLHDNVLNFILAPLIELLGGDS